MNIKRKLLNTAIKCVKNSAKIAGKSVSTRILANLSEELVPVLVQKTDHGNINLFCPGEIPEWRARNLLKKEPETIDWIDTFSGGEVLWDIGANVGSYSLYAALRKMKVLAFEPSPGNYYLLMRNIEANKFDDMISSYCIAFSDSTRLAEFHMLDTVLGGAHSSFGEAIDYKGKNFTATYKQAMVGYEIDKFIEYFEPSFPNHIKIDVDGVEHRIIEGARKTLSDERIRSVLIELDESRMEHDRTMVTFEDAGLHLKKKVHSSEFDNGDSASLYNFIFSREI